MIAAAFRIKTKSLKKKKGTQYVLLKFQRTQRKMKNRDLTVGKPSSVLWRFCMPLFGSIIFQQLYNIADSLIAGKFIGENALAAVGNSYEITLIFIAFAFGINIGCSVIVSRLFGAKRFSDMKTAVYTTFISGGALCALLMATGLLFGDKLLELIKTPAGYVFENSKLYLDIYIYGLPFVFFYNISTGIFSAMGDSQTPFIFLAASSLSNIAVDILFVTVFKMGVAGVAWATFLCQCVSCLLAVIFMFRRLNTVKTIEKAKCFSWMQLKEISVIAIPSILQQSFISVGNIIIQGVINGFGSVVMAGYSASIKLNNLVTTSFTTLGSGISNYTAQNLGADKYDRIKPGFRAGLKLIWILCIPITALYFFAGKPLVSFFMKDPGSEAVRVGIQFLKIVSPFYFAIAVKFVSDGVLRGAGKMKQFMVSTFTDLILRVVLAVVLAKQFDIIGVWLAWPIGWVIAVIISFAFYKAGKWDKSPAEQEAERIEKAKRRKNKHSGAHKAASKTVSPAENAPQNDAAQSQKNDPVK